MDQLKEIDKLRMKRRKKEVEANGLRDKIHDIEEEIKELDQRIIGFKQVESGGGFGGIDL